MKLPTYIKLVCLKDGQPAGGLFATIILKTRHKNDIVMSGGPSDEQGVIFINKQQIEESARWATSTFPMDYTGLADLSGEIRVKPKDQGDIRRALRGYEMFRSSYPFPPKFAEQLQDALVSLDQVSPAHLHVRVEHDGKDVTIQTDTAEV